MDKGIPNTTIWDISQMFNETDAKPLSEFNCTFNSVFITVLSEMRFG